MLRIPLDELPESLERLEPGEPVLLVKDNDVVAELRRVPPTRTQPRPIGLAKGQFTVPKDFNVPQSLMEDASRSVLPIPWYREGDWPRLLEVAVDSEETLEPTWDQWYRVALEELYHLTIDLAYAVVPIDVAVDHLITWCRSHSRSINNEARFAYALHRFQLRQHNAS